MWLQVFSRLKAYVPFCEWSAPFMRHAHDVPTECLLGRWLHRAGVPVERGRLLGARTACMWNLARLFDDAAPAGLGRVRDNCTCDGKSANHSRLVATPKTHILAAYGGAPHVAIADLRDTQRDLLAAAFALKATNTTRA